MQESSLEFLIDLWEWEREDVLYSSTTKPKPCKGNNRMIHCKTVYTKNYKQSAIGDNKIFGCNYEIVQQAYTVVVPRSKRMCNGCKG